MNTYCNPLDLGYRYQHHREGNKFTAVREGADPTLVFFKGSYYMFVSMSAGFWYSENLLDWKFHANPELLMYDYAPDVRQIGGYLYFCASRWANNCPILRTADPLSDRFEEVSAPFPFWDPDIFCDDDGRVYLYWGCSNTAPIFGVELDAATMLPVGEKRELIFGNEDELGYERPGDSGLAGKETNALYQALKKLADPATGELHITPETEAALGHDAEALKKMFDTIGRPYVEGAFMTKHAGRYYLQYSAPGTEYNTYLDGVYVSEHPLGPFVRQKSNPFSSKPGGFITGAGHGSTIADRYGNYWHCATMRISVGHLFERRVGLFPAGFDEDGELYCNQNFADYPHRVPQGKFDAMSQQPEWMLLSFKKPARASSAAEGSSPSLAVNEDIRTWWSAGTADVGEWLAVDLERVCRIHAVQVNLADEGIGIEFPDESYGNEMRTRHIETRPQISRYRVEISRDGTNWSLLEEVKRECSNGYYEYMEGVDARFVRVVGGKLPYDQPLRISGLRVFGAGDGGKPPQARARTVRLGDWDASVEWDPIPGAQGCNVRYGVAPDKLYHAWLVYDASSLTLSTLIKGQDYYICVDSFNENGVTEGAVIHLERA